MEFKKAIKWQLKIVKMTPLPKKGDKIQFKGGKLFAFHVNCIENAKNLTPGELYTVNTVEVYSSWTKITVDEFPTKGRFADNWLSLSFFEWPRCQVIKNTPEGSTQCKNPAEYTYMAAREGEISEYCSITDYSNRCIEENEELVY